MPQTNTATLSSLYEAFARGDLPAVREKMSPDIEWCEAENSPYEDGNPYAILDGVYSCLTGEWDGLAEEVRSILDTAQFREVTSG